MGVSQRASPVSQGGVLASGPAVCGCGCQDVARRLRCVAGDPVLGSRSGGEPHRSVEIGHDDIPAAWEALSCGNGTSFS
jgi:hypothetical protein